MRGHAPAGDTAPGHRPREDPAQSLVVADDTRPATIAVLDAHEHSPAQCPGCRDPLPDRCPAPREHPAQARARALGAQARARVPVRACAPPFGVLAAGAVGRATGGTTARDHGPAIAAPRAVAIAVTTTAMGKGTAGITIATDGDRDASPRDMATAIGHGPYLPSRIGS